MFNTKQISINTPFDGRPARVPASSTLAPSFIDGVPGKAFGNQIF